MEPSNNLGSFLRAFARDNHCFPQAADPQKFSSSSQNIIEKMDVIGNDIFGLYLAISNSPESKKDLESIFAQAANISMGMGQKERTAISNKCIDIYNKINQLANNLIRFPDLWKDKLKPVVGEKVQLENDLRDLIDWQFMTGEDSEITNLHLQLLKYFEFDQPNPLLLDAIIRKLHFAKLENPTVLAAVSLLIEAIFKKDKSYPIDPQLLIKILREKGSLELWKCFITQWKGNPQSLGLQSVFFKYLARDVLLLMQLLQRDSFQEKFRNIIEFYCKHLIPAKQSDYSIRGLATAVFHFASFCEKFPHKDYIPQEVFHRISHRSEIATDDPKNPVEITGPQLWALIVSSHYFHSLATFGSKESYWINTKAKTNLSLPENFPKADLELFIDRLYTLEPKQNKLTCDEWLRMFQIAKFIGAETRMDHCVDHIKYEYFDPYLYRNQYTEIDEIITKSNEADLPEIQRALVETIISRFQRENNKNTLFQEGWSYEGDMTMVHFAMKYMEKCHHRAILEVISLTISNVFRAKTIRYHKPWPHIFTYVKHSLNLAKDHTSTINEEKKEDLLLEFSNISDKVDYHLVVDLNVAYSIADNQVFLKDLRDYNEYFNSIINCFEGYPIKKLIIPLPKERSQDERLKEEVRKKLPKTDVVFV